MGSTLLCPPLLQTPPNNIKDLKAQVRLEQSPPKKGRTFGRQAKPVLNTELQESVYVQGIECLGKVKVHNKVSSAKSSLVCAACRRMYNASGHAQGRDRAKTGRRHRPRGNQTSSGQASRKFEENFTTHNGVIHASFLGHLEHPARGQLSIGLLRRAQTEIQHDRQHMQTTGQLKKGGKEFSTVPGRAGSLIRFQLGHPCNNFSFREVRFQVIQTLKANGILRDVLKTLIKMFFHMGGSSRARTTPGHQTTRSRTQTASHAALEQPAGPPVTFGSRQEARLSTAGAQEHATDRYPEKAAGAGQCQM